MVINYLEKNLSAKYGIHKINGKQFIRFSNFGFLRHAFCIEYADNIEQVKQWIFPEDGDLFYISEMIESNTLNSMIKEIEG